MQSISFYGLKSSVQWPAFSAFLGELSRVLKIPATRDMSWLAVTFRGREFAGQGY